MADKYVLKVTAGPTYADQTQIPINTESPTSISSSFATTSLTLRIQNYRGLPAGSPSTSPYFSTAPHTSDLYSLQFSFTPKEDVNGNDMVFGNDFDHPIRDKLPPGFQQAFNIVKWFIDPGLYGDVYADEPYLYGPMLSSINTLRIGGKDDRAREAEEEKRANAEVHLVEEGAEEGEGEESRHNSKVPATAAARKKHFLTEAHLKDFTFEKGREYACDFFNPYLDFNDFALRLPGYGLIPGITLPIISYWDGQPLRSHTLRYVLKNRKTDEPLWVVVFTLQPKEALDAENEKKDKTTSSETKPAIHTGSADDDLD
ncbi:hypothetical protein LTR95_002351 [Oleoguttula sp. CCFEE 5521]